MEDKEWGLRAKYLLPCCCVPDSIHLCKHWVIHPLEMPQSQTTDKPAAPWGRDSKNTNSSNHWSFPQQVDCNKELLHRTRTKHRLRRDSSWGPFEEETLTLYSMITPLDALEILWQMEHLLFWSQCSIFHNIFKRIQNFTLIFLEFFRCLQNRKWCHDLKIAYEVMG